MSDGLTRISRSAFEELMSEWEWATFIGIAIRRGYKDLHARRSIIQQSTAYGFFYRFMSGCPQHVAREILDEIRAKGGDDMSEQETTATLTHKGKTVPMPDKLPAQKELDFGKRYEVVIVTKRDKAIAKILDGLSELGVLDSDMNGVMRFIAQQVPEIADHQSINT